MLSALELWGQFREGEPDLSSKDWLKFCELCHWIRKKEVKILEQRFYKNVLDREEARKIWRKIHK